MPSSLVARSFWGISLAQWILWAASIVLPLLLFWTAALCVVASSRRLIRDTTRRAVFEAWWKGVRWLFIMALTLGTHVLLMPWLGFSLTFRYTYSRVALVVAVIISALLAVRLVSVTFAHAGVGIAGVAVALGAQKSIENLVGAIFLLTDRALAV